VKEYKKNFETKLSKNIKDDKKSFFAYARSKVKKSKVKVGPVTDGEGRLVTDSAGMTEVFNEQFSAVFRGYDLYSAS